MQFSLKLFFIAFCSFVLSCKVSEKPAPVLPKKQTEIVASAPKKAKQEPNDSTFVNIKDYSSDFLLDMKYATSDNFLKTQVYDCAECYLRFRTVKALAAANKSFLEKGYHIKIFDCYRPLDVQKKMWKIVSNPDYVANPTKGSIHNRGGAVDLTLVDSVGIALDMGTAFDHFGKEAAYAYPNLPETVKANRKLLKDVMETHGFKVLKSEWWHFNLNDSETYNVSNFTWNCN